jgi:hypothetical protein
MSSERHRKPPVRYDAGWEGRGSLIPDTGWRMWVSAAPFLRRPRAVRVFRAGALTYPEGQCKMTMCAAARHLERLVSVFAPVAQLDRALAYEARGREFESLRAYHPSPLVIIGLACSQFLLPSQKWEQLGTKPPPIVPPPPVRPRAGDGCKSWLCSRARDRAKIAGPASAHLRCLGTSRMCAEERASGSVEFPAGHRPARYGDRERFICSRASPPRLGKAIPICRALHEATNSGPRRGPSKWVLDAHFGVSWEC